MNALESFEMKRWILVLMIILLLTLTIVVPAFASPHNGKACKNIGISGHYFGWTHGKGGWHHTGPEQAKLRNACP